MSGLRPRSSGSVHLTLRGEAAHAEEPSRSKRQEGADDGRHGAHFGLSQYWPDGKDRRGEEQRDEAVQSGAADLDYSAVVATIAGETPQP